MIGRSKPRYTDTHVCLISLPGQASKINCISSQTVITVDAIITLKVKVRVVVIAKLSAESCVYIELNKRQNTESCT